MFTKNDFGPARIQMIALGDLEPHQTVQRPLTERRWRKYHRKFDPKKFDHLRVFPANGTNEHFLIWDGQHRWKAAITLLGSDHKVPCLVYASMEDAQAADMSSQ